MVDKPLIDEQGKGLLFAGNSTVELCAPVEGQNNVFLLTIRVELERNSQLAPLPGQFYMLSSLKSRAYFDRPISVYKCSETVNAGNGHRVLHIQFLILEKGVGTAELCHMIPGEQVRVKGPLGNTWLSPLEESGDTQAIAKIRQGKAKLCIVGGGIGIAPVANLAASLPAKSYDFFASFKSGSYGIDSVDAAKLTVTTDDGSVGVHGMLSAALTADAVKTAAYDYIFACGPTPMLAYVQKIADECGVKAFLSMEHRMLCGAGACLGCTIQTKNGTIRVCKDGPVFSADILEFAPPPPRPAPLPKDVEPDLGVSIAGVHFKNPVIAASGTFGYGQIYRSFCDVGEWGGISSKGTTLEPRQGNPGERSIEVPSGNINSIGLQNPGMEEVVQKLLPEMMELPTTTMLNIAGHDIDSYVKAVSMADKTDVPMIELNISCPNVKAGGAAWGMDPDSAYQCVSAVRAATTKPLMVKLSPNAPDLRAVAMACVKAGADALSLVNTFQATAIDIETGKPFFNNIRAGLCGPAIKPIALRMVYDVVEEMNKLPVEKRIPVVGIGGIEKWQDAVEFIMAGACAVQVGSSKFANPHVAGEITRGLSEFMKRKGYRKLSDFCGISQTGGSRAVCLN